MRRSSDLLNTSFWLETLIILTETVRLWYQLTRWAIMSALLNCVCHWIKWEKGQQWETSKIFTKCRNTWEEEKKIIVLLHAFGLEMVVITLNTAATFIRRELNVKYYISAQNTHPKKSGSGSRLSMWKMMRCPSLFHHYPTVSFFFTLIWWTPTQGHELLTLLSQMRNLFRAPDMFKWKYRYLAPVQSSEEEVERFIDVLIFCPTASMDWVLQLYRDSSVS